MSEDRRKDLRDMLDELNGYFEDFEKDIEEAVKSSILGDDKWARPFIAGFSFNVGPEGKPRSSCSETTGSGNGSRSPINEQVIDEKNGVLRLLLEMPGVEKRDIRVEATEDTAVITAENDDKKYRAEIDLKQVFDLTAARQNTKTECWRFSSH